MRWLLAKDLRILWRSPFVCLLLVAYPIVLGVLVGFALQGDSSKPRVAYVNEVPPDEGLALSGEPGEFGGDEARAELCKRVECVDADSREQAEQMVADGDVLGALILPADLVDQLESLTGLNPESPTVDVMVSEDDPLKASLVNDRIEALLADGNFVLSQRIAAEAKTYLDLLIHGGHFEVPLLGESVNILGLDRSAAILGELAAELPERGNSRELMAEVEQFASVAGDNVDLALPLLGALAQPIGVNKITVNGEVGSLDSFAIALAVTITLMFVTTLLVSGSLALERDENAIARIIATTGRWRLVGEKILLGLIAGVVVALIALVALTPFVPIAWDRLALIAAALAGAGAACSAFGAALGSVAREVRAASLAAVMLTLPLVFLSLVPSGAVAAGVYDAVRVVRSVFPFEPALEVVTGALDSADGTSALTIAQLVVLTLAYAVVARVGLRRTAT